MSQLREISAVLQVGTQRAPVGSMDALGDFPATSVPRTALLQAGTAALMAYAGAVPRSGLIAIEPCPPETQPIALASTAPLLEALASKATAPILEWAERAQHLGFVAPHETLLGLLPMATNPAICGVLGVRGRWLANQQGVAVARPISPEEVRSQVTNEWSGADPKQRVAWLEALTVHVTPDDEPWLITAVNDGRQEVRTAAAQLLLRLETSGLRQALIQVAPTVIRLEKAFLRKSLVVTPPLPDQLPKPLPRLKKWEGFGEKALALYDFMRAIPPQTWSELTGLDHATFLSELVKTEYAEAARIGIRQAALFFSDQVWIDALFEDGVARRTKQDELWDEISHRASAATFARLIPKMGKEQWAMTCILRSKRPLDLASSRAVLPIIMPDDTYGYRIKELSDFLSPACRPDVEKHAASLPESNGLRDALRRLDLRQRILASLPNP